MSKNKRIDRLNQIDTLKTIGIYVGLSAAIAIMCWLATFLNQ